MEFERILALYMNDCYTRQLRPKTMHRFVETIAHRALIKEKRAIQQNTD